MAAGFGSTVDMSLDDLVSKNKKTVRSKMGRRGARMSNTRGRGRSFQNSKVGKNSRRKVNS